MGERTVRGEAHSVRNTNTRLLKPRSGPRLSRHARCAQNAVNQCGLIDRSDDVELAGNSAELLKQLYVNWET
jgi:hypothetical protein